MRRSEPLFDTQSTAANDSRKSCSLFEIFYDIQLASVEVFEGDWQSALRRSVDDLDLAQRVGFTRATAMALTIQGLVFIRRGRLDQAAERPADPSPTLT